MESSIKKEVLSLVQQIEDEDLLQLLKADIEFFKGGTDIADRLSPDDLEELRIQANEEAFKDTISEEEYNQFLNKWRTK